MMNLKKDGSDCPNAKLTDEQVKWCRDVYIPSDKEYGASALARKFKMSSSNMSAMIRGKTYKNVK